MTNEQIVKALECCVECDTFCDGCREDCPFIDVDNCTFILRRETLALIKRQQEEIERLKQTPKCVFAYDGETLEYCVEGPCSAEKTIETIRAEAVREFAEKLKETNLYEFIEEYFDNAELCYEVRSDLFNDFVDNLVKEMTEKEGGKG